MVEKSHVSGFWPSLYDPFRQMGTRAGEWFAPACEASVTGAGYRIALEVPGVAETDIDVSVHDGVVTVKGQKTSEHDEKDESWYFSERQFGRFSRSFRLPPDAEEGAVSAAPKEGVLSITVGKKAAAPEGGVKVLISKV